MRGSYKQCDACGKRALSIAIRCPGCGRELPANQVPKRSGGLELGRFITPKGVAAVLAVAAVLVSVKLGETSQPREAKAEVESSMATTGLSARTGPSDTARVAELPVESGRGLRVARSWTEVRKSRSGRAPIEAMLMPGDTVRADSLEQGWYRVALEGEVLGYAQGWALAAPSKLLIPSAARDLPQPE